MKSLFTFLLLSLCSSYTFAEVTVSSLINDHMVFQRGEPCIISGWADAEELVSVILDGITLEGSVFNGEWSVTFPAREEGGPYSLTIKGNNQLDFIDIYFGDVYLLSGQSNMEWPSRLINNAEEELLDASYPLIRVFTVDHDITHKKVDKLNTGKWDKLNKETALDFSGIGFLYGRALFKEKGIPIGLIDNSWGGSAIKTYMDRACFHDKTDYQEELKAFDSIQASWAQIKSIIFEWGEGLDGADVGRREKWFVPGTDFSDWTPAELPGNWEQSTFPGLDGIVWYTRNFNLSSLPQKDGMAYLGRIDDKDISYINGYKIGSIEGYNIDRKYSIPIRYLKEGKNEIVIKVTDYGGGGGISANPNKFYLNIGGETIDLSGTWKCRIGTSGYPSKQDWLDHNYFPTGKYNAMVHPLIKHKLAGILWYQGETDARDGYNYRWLFKRMIVDWRNKWKQAELPFLYVQLANWLEVPKTPGPSHWARLREAQAMAQDLPYTAMVSAIDVGEADDIHPRDKQTVAKRLVKAGKGLVYGDHIPYLHPEVANLTVTTDGYLVTFKNVGKGLKSKNTSNIVRGFSIPSIGGSKYVNAKIISYDEVFIPQTDPEKGMLRYLWADNPGKVDLYSTGDLPALPFEWYVE